MSYLMLSGTEKQHVADDYVMRLSEGTDSCHDAMNDAFRSEYDRVCALVRLVRLSNDDRICA